MKGSINQFAGEVFALIGNMPNARTLESTNNPDREITAAVVELDGGTRILITFADAGPADPDHGPVPRERDRYEP